MNAIKKFPQGCWYIRDKYIKSQKENILLLIKD